VRETRAKRDERMLRTRMRVIRAASSSGVDGVAPCVEASVAATRELVPVGREEAPAATRVSLLKDGMETMVVERKTQGGGWVGWRLTHSV